MIKLFCKLSLLCSLLALGTGCATVKSPDERDPWESFNRTMFEFNDAFDRAIARPVAQAYKDYVPGFVRHGVANVFSNLDDVVVFINDILQFKFEQAAMDFARLIVNSIVGVFGLFDVAKHWGLPKHNEDFGQTLAAWGVGDGPYMILPFLGPKNVRDTVGMAADWQIDPVLQITDDEARWGLIVLRALDTRAEFLEATKTMDKSGIDPYVFMRDAYFQFRLNRIYDGNPPREKIKESSKEDRLLEQDLEKELQDLK